MAREVETAWEPDAEWVVEFLKKPEMEIYRVNEVIAGSEALAVMFAFRFLASDGVNISKESLKHLRTERVN